MPTVRRKHRSRLWLHFLKKFRQSSAPHAFTATPDWDKMKTKKQAKKGKQINKKVSKGAMPPKGFLEKHPDAVLTAEQKKTISAWVRAMPKN
jgi:hypothetical protein